MMIEGGVGAGAGRAGAGDLLHILCHPGPPEGILKQGAGTLLPKMSTSLVHLLHQGQPGVRVRHLLGGTIRHTAVQLAIGLNQVNPSTLQHPPLLHDVRGQGVRLQVCQGCWVMPNVNQG